MKKGLKKGRAAERKRIAKRAIVRGLRVRMVSEITGLSVGKVRKLKKSIAKK